MCGATKSARLRRAAGEEDRLLAPHLLEMLLRAPAFASRSMTGPISVAGSAGSPRRSSAAAPAIIASIVSATSSCTKRMRQAEQRWPAERKAEVTTSSATCSGSAVASAIMALMPPVSAISGTIGPSFAASARLIFCADLGRAGEGDAGDARIVDQRRADRAVARHEIERIDRNAGRVQELHRLEGDERRLLGGLGDDGIAGGERRGDLAGENRQRKIPRADADEDAAAAQAIAVLLAGRAGQDRFRAEEAARLGGVVAAEIGRLADFRDAVVERLAALVREQRDEAVAVLLDQVGGAFERCGALVRGRPLPGVESRRPPLRSLPRRAPDRPRPPFRRRSRRPPARGPRDGDLRAPARRSAARHRRSEARPRQRRCVSADEIGAAAELHAARVLARAENADPAARSSRGAAMRRRQSSRRAARAGSRPARPDR